LNNKFNYFFNPEKLTTKIIGKNSRKFNIKPFSPIFPSTPITENYSAHVLFNIKSSKKKYCGKI
jgi:hypothetical protein